MKKAITLLTVLCYLTTTAQYHGAENNYYTFSEKDSVAVQANSLATVFDNGSVVVWPYGGQFKLLGNNYTRKLPAPLDGDVVHPVIYSLANKNVWISQSSKAYLLAPDKIIDSFTCNGDLRKMADGRGNVLWFTYTKDESILLGKFQNNKITEPVDPGYTLNHYSMFWKNSSGQLFIGTPKEYCEILETGFGPVQRYLLPHTTYYIHNANTTLNSIIASTHTSTNSFDLFSIKGSLMRKIIPTGELKFPTQVNNGYMVLNKLNSSKDIVHLTDSGEAVVTRLSTTDFLTNVTKANESSFYVSGQNTFVRSFNFIKKYPHLFKGNNSESIFSIQQANDGTIWAGSYNGFLTRIYPEGIQSINNSNVLISNGGCTIGDKVYLIGEGENNGLLQFDKNRKFRKITKNVTGFINYVDSTNGTFYFGTSGKGLWYTSMSSLKKEVVPWDTASQDQGLSLPNIVSITKDKTGRLWLGQPSRGWAVYNPTTNKARTWLIEKNDTDYGLMSSFTDNRGTVWLGSKQKGLLYYNNYRSDTVSATDIQQIIHPLLVPGKTITAIKQWGNWLIFGATDYYLALNLETWYSNQQVLIRYLNPQEAAFTGTTEQNTLLVDKRDSSVWFSTSDMLYQWDFKSWLTLPLYKIAPNAELLLNGKQINLSENKSLRLEPVENNLDFSIWFQSPDNMPRYLSVALFKKGDSLNFAPVGVATHFNYTNLAPGKYILAVQICQSDGSVSIHQFPISIKSFWWQLWWVWLAAFLLCTLVAVYIINIRRKKILAEAIIKRKEAEMETFKEAQQKKLAHLQLVSLSNQFRPHFILNALNTIGAQMDENPQAESVLSRLGESINLIFNHAQQQQMAHSFADEWTLVKNIISIHQLMYLKKLETKLPNEETLSILENSIMPLGLLQIPVENALLHGLSNKENGPWLLEITIHATSDAFVITITDNGVGRKKAGRLSNYRKHGTGTKNLSDILSILNRNKKEQITITYKDDIFIDAVEPYGTSVIVNLPKTFSYDS